MGRENIQPSLKGRALRLLSQREHSRQELERKLARYEAEPGALVAVLDELQAKGFICEERVLQSVLHRRAAKLGAARLRQELLEKGLPRERVEQAMNGLLGSEQARASAVWRKKYGERPDTAQERARQARFLIARGFSAEVVRRVLEQAPGEESV